MVQPVHWRQLSSLFTLCTFQLPSIQSPINPACRLSIIFPTSNVTRPRISSWWSCPLSMFSPCVAPSTKSSRRTRFCHMASVPMPSQSEACPHCTWDCPLSVWNRRHYVSQRMDTRVARETACKLPSSRSGTACTFHVRRLLDAGLQLHGMRSGSQMRQRLWRAGAIIHGESDDTVASPMNIETTEK